MQRTSRCTAQPNLLITCISLVDFRVISRNNDRMAHRSVSVRKVAFWFAVVLLSCSTRRGGQNGDEGQGNTDQGQGDMVNSPYCSGWSDTTYSYCVHAFNEPAWREGLETPIGQYHCICGDQAPLDVDIGEDCERTMAQTCAVDLDAPRCSVQDGSGGNFVCSPVGNEADSWECQCSADPGESVIVMVGSCEQAALMSCSAACSSDDGSCSLDSDGNYSCQCADGRAAVIPPSAPMGSVGQQDGVAGDAGVDHVASATSTAAPGLSPCHSALDLSCTPGCQTSLGSCRAHSTQYDCACSSGVFIALPLATGNCSTAVELACGS